MIILVILKFLLWTLKQNSKHNWIYYNMTLIEFYIFISIKFNMSKLMSYAGYFSAIHLIKLDGLYDWNMLQMSVRGRDSYRLSYLSRSNILLSRVLSHTSHAI